MQDWFGKDINLDSVFYNYFDVPQEIIVDWKKVWAISQELFDIEEAKKLLYKFACRDWEIYERISLRFVRWECAYPTARWVMKETGVNLLPWIKPVRVHANFIYNDPRITK